MANLMTGSKNSPEEKHIICTVYPVGCRMNVTVENGIPVSVTGNSCPRGKKYALSEISNPRRTLTSSIPVKGKDRCFLPVKTDKPIPKSSIQEAMKQIKNQTAIPPISIGDVIISDFIDEGISLIACKDIE